MKNLMPLFCLFIFSVFIVSCTKEEPTKPQLEDEIQNPDLKLQELLAQYNIDYQQFNLAATAAREKTPQSSDVLDNYSNAVVGNSQINRHPNSVTVNYSTTPENMTANPAGHAVTFWAIVFNSNFEFVSFGWLNGKVIGNNGNVNISGNLPEGESDGPFVLDADTDIVILINRSHGLMIPEYMPSMIETICGGCLCGDDGADGEAGPNTCDDLSYTFHF
jgi:hypothetical protein